MADEHDRTTLEFEADTSKVRGLGEEIERAMDTRPLERLEDQAKDLDRAFGDLVGKQADLTRELVNIDRGTEAYKKLRQELRGVAEETRAVQSAMAGVQRRSDSLRPPPAPTPRPTDAALAAQWLAGGGGATIGRGAASLSTGLIAGASPGAISGALSSAGAGLSGAAMGLGVAVGVPLLLAGMALRSGMATAGAGRQYAALHLGVAPFLGAGHTALTGVAQPFGIGPQAALQTAAGIARSAGGTTSTAMLQAALAAQTYGVDTGTTAGLFRTFRPGRGASGDPLGTLAALLGSGQRMGLEGTELSEHFAHLINTVQSLGQRGMQVGYSGPARMAENLSALPGFGGLQATRVASGLTSAVAQSGMTGPQGAVGVALLRAAGYSGGGAEEYAKALFRMQEDPSGVASAALQSISGSLSGGPNAKAMIMQRVMASMGVEVSGKQAGALLGGQGSSMMFGTEEPGDLVADARNRAWKAGLGGIPQRDASLGRARVAVGLEVAPIAQNIERAQLELARTMGAMKEPLLDLTNMAASAARGLRELVDALKKKKKKPSNDPTDDPNYPKPILPFTGVGGRGFYGR